MSISGEMHFHRDVYVGWAPFASRRFLWHQKYRDKRRDETRGGSPWEMRMVRRAQ